MPKVGQQLKSDIIPLTFDAIVAPSAGDYTTIQAADDVLDAGPYTLIVKTSTYAGYTVATDKAYILHAPATVITSAITISGDDCTLRFAPGCDIQAVITISGNNCRLICENACDLVGIVLSGNYNSINGGGIDILIDGGVANHAVSISGTDCIVENFACQTTAGGGQAFDGINISAARGTIKKIKVVDSDNEGIAVQAAGTDVGITGCNILGADNDGIDLLGPRARIIGVYIYQAGADGVDVGATGDNSVIDGNIVQDPTGDPINIGADDCVVVANRTDGATVDGVGTSVVADNDEAAF